RPRPAPAPPGRTAGPGTSTRPGTPRAAGEGAVWPWCELLPVRRRPGKIPGLLGVLCPTRTRSGRLPPAQGAEPRRQADEGRELPQPLALPPVAFQQLADPPPELATLVGAEVVVHGPGRSDGPDQGGGPDEVARRATVPERVVPVQRRFGGCRGA